MSSLVWLVDVNEDKQRGEAHAFVSREGVVERLPLCRWGSETPEPPHGVAPATSEEITTRRCDCCDDDMRDRGAP